MTADDHELETLLRGFRPVAPLPLRAPGSRRRRIAPWLAGLAAAAALAVVATRSVRQAEPRPESPGSRASVGALNAAVRAGQYETALDTLAVEMLPDPRQPGRALRVAGDVSQDRRILAGGH
jgi:hypothetical protein